MKRLSTNEKLKKMHVTLLNSHLMRLDEMAGLINRSAFVRDLIDQEYYRRHPETKKVEASDENRAQN